MNKQLVNLIGAAASVAIILLGVVVFALPLFSSAGKTAASADDVATQNRTQQTVLDSLTAQSADMTELNAAVNELRAEIPEAAHLDDVLLLAVQAVAENGGTVTSVTPEEAEEFAVRVDEADAAATAAAAAPATETTEAGTEAGAETPASAPAAPSADAAQQVGVTLVIEANDVAAATSILDALREGPRLVAVTQATTTTSAENRVTLTVTLLAFYRP